MIAIATCEDGCLSCPLLISGQQSAGFQSLKLIRFNIRRKSNERRLVLVVSSLNFQARNLTRDAPYKLETLSRYCNEVKTRQAKTVGKCGVSIKESTPALYIEFTLRVVSMAQHGP
jgi:hypothetical protein